MLPFLALKKLFFHSVSWFHYLLLNDGVKFPTRKINTKTHKAEVLLQLKH